MSTHIDKYLSVSQAARLLNVSTQIIYIWAKAGKIKTRGIGGHLFIDSTNLKRPKNRHRTMT